MIERCRQPVVAAIIRVFGMRRNVRKLGGEMSLFKRISWSLPLLLIAGLATLPFQAQQATSPAAPDPNDPGSPHNPGIYLYQNGRMTLMQSSQASEKGSGFGMVGSGKAKISVSGTHAALQMTDTVPVFYFYFEKQQSGFGSTSGAPISTDQFKLLRFEVKKSDREAVVMQVNAFSGSTKIPDKEVVAFSSAPVGNNGFKVKPNSPLAPGEYCFFASGVLMTVFDFGILEKK